MKYKLNVNQDVDVDGGSFGYETSYILNLPLGFKFYDDAVHVRGYDSMQELRKAAKEDIEVCFCNECKQ